MAYPHQELTHKIIAAAIEVHKFLGPGLLESAYKICLAHEFDSLCLKYEQELVVPLVYKKENIDCGFRLDFLVDDTVVLEIKATESILPVHEAQLLTYLRLTNKQVGLLINFNVPLLKQGIYRRVLNVCEFNDKFVKDPTGLAEGKIPSAQRSVMRRREH